MKWNTQLRVTRYTYLHVIINGNNNHIARSKRDCGVDVGECRRRIEMWIEQSKRKVPIHQFPAFTKHKKEYLEFCKKRVEKDPPQKIVDK